MYTNLRIPTLVARWLRVYVTSSHPNDKKGRMAI